VRPDAVSREVKDGRVYSALAQNRAPNGCRCKRPANIATLIEEEFVHCTIGDRVSAHDRDTASSQASAHLCSTTVFCEIWC
jgi:hypothetical protein